MWARPPALVLAVAAAGSCGLNEPPRTIHGFWRHASKPVTIEFFVRTDEAGDCRIVDESKPNTQVSGTYIFITSSLMKLQLVHVTTSVTETQSMNFTTNSDTEVRVTLGPDILVLKASGYPPDEYRRVQ